MQATERVASGQLVSCFHCGEPVPPGLDLFVTIKGDNQPMCCPGCSAVASMIADSGLDTYYQQRTSFNERPDAAPVDQRAQYLIYDDPEVAGTFVETNEDQTLSARLLLGGVTCAACTWLIEKSLAQVEGVVTALVNLQQARLDIRFDPASVPLSQIFSRLDALGYRPRPYQASTQRKQVETDYRRDLRQLGVAALGMMQVGMFAIALHAGDIQGIDLRYQGLLRWVSLLVASFVVFYSARPFFVSAWRHLKLGALVMDLPVALAIGLAWVASVWATLTSTGQVYFDSVVMFTFFLLLGRFLERRVRQRHTMTWFDAENTLPPVASVRRLGQWETISRIQLQAGDEILVNAGDTVPADALVLSGHSAVKEDTFNGEHLPRNISAGDTVYAGTINMEAALQARVTGDYRNSRLAALQRSVETAQTEKPRLARLADHIASWFVAGILLVTVATTIAWSQIAPEQAFWVTLSVLVISCPCALALATPAALTTAASALRSGGVIVRGENALEALSRATHMVFDKTGTLTEGALVISRVQRLGDTGEDELLAIAAALQAYSSHPIAAAFDNTSPAPGLEDVQYHVGRGLEGRKDGVNYRLGSDTFCREQAPDLPAPPDNSLYWVALVREQRPEAWIGLGDSTRAEAAGVVDYFRKEGLELELLTGDSSGHALSLAEQLGIRKVLRGALPQQKMAHVSGLQREGAVVCMVGDGLNDAPVLSLADASFAVAGATDLARNQADFVVVGGDLRAVARTWRKARRCRATIIQNFAWALGYNLCAIPLAAAGFVPPWAAAIGMSASSLLVVINSLRLNSRR